MEPYIYKRTRDGVHYLDLKKTWEKLMIAARIIGAVQAKNPKDVLVSALAIAVNEKTRFLFLVDVD
jgi:ribosomal protein S2